MQALQHHKIKVETLSTSFHQRSDLTIEIARLDLIHPIISGNKWYKLRYYLEDAIQQNKKRIVTWGGAWSNHIVATAAACQYSGMKSLGLIRGELTEQPSATLQEAAKMGMEFYFIPRENYRHKIIPEQITNNEDYIIPEGGYGLLGVKGAATILEQVNTAAYSHIVCAVGTGTMMAGIIHASSATTRVIGIPVVKGADAIQSSIEKMLTQPTAHWQLIPGYEWGGYAKHPDPLLDFMNQFYQTCQIPTDIVYTGKLFYALRDLVAKDYFPSGSKILVIHSGGLQGNRSLHPATLCFNVN